MDTATYFITPGIVFMLTLVFGVWLGLAGKPYNGLLFNVHKLIALGAVIVTATQTYSALKNTEIPALVVALLVLAAVCVVALFVTGALMSIGQPADSRLLTIHRVATILAVAGMAVLIYLLGGSNL